MYVCTVKPFHSLEPVVHHFNRIMRKHILITLLLAASLFSFSLYGQEIYDVEDVPNVHLQDKDQYVSDPLETMSSSMRERLNAAIAKVMKERDVEIAVVVIPRIDTSKYPSERDFANKLFNTWKIGNKETDRGLLMVYITDKSQRSITFEVGYGLEADLPDGLCYLIQQEAMIPLLKEGNTAEGLIAGVEEVDKVLGGESSLKKEYEESAGDDWLGELMMWAFIVVLLLVGGVLLYGMSIELVLREMKKSVHDPYLTMVKLRESPFYFSTIVWSTILCCSIPALIVMVVWFWVIKIRFRRAFVCEACGKAGTTKYVGNSVPKEPSVASSGIKIHEFRCTACGHNHIEQTSIRLSDKKLFGGGYRDGVVDYRTQISAIRSSYRGGSSGGGSSSSGGSWGGGSSGGGGSSSRF